MQPEQISEIETVLLLMASGIPLEANRAAVARDLFDSMRLKFERQHDSESAVSRIAEAMDNLLVVMGNLLDGLDPYHEGFCIVCGCPQPSRKHKHDHDDDCAYVASQKEWQSFQPPDDGPTLEDLS